MAEAYHSASRGNEVQATQCHSLASVWVSAHFLSSPHHSVHCKLPRQSMQQLTLFTIHSKWKVTFKLFLTFLRGERSGVGVGKPAKAPERECSSNAQASGNSSFFFFLSFCLSVILASIIPSHHVCGLDIVFSGKTHDAASDRAANNEEQEQIQAHGHDESSYPEPELLAVCDTDFPSSSCRADEALKTCE